MIPVRCGRGHVGSPGSETASWPIAAVDVAGLASSLVGAVARLPFRTPWRGPSNGPRNLAVSTTRELTPIPLGYRRHFRSMSSAPWSEFLMRSPARYCSLSWRSRGSRSTRTISVACRGSGSTLSGRDRNSPGTIVYLHGGGYIGTSPRMYALFLAHLARVTGCAIFVADYRLAPEFPFPAAAEDILAVANHWWPRVSHPNVWFSPAIRVAVDWWAPFSIASACTPRDDRLPCCCSRPK